MKLLYYLVLLPLSKLPFGIRYKLGQFISFILSSIIPYRKSLIKNNLSLCFPNKDSNWLTRTYKEFYDNLGQILVESIRAFSIHKEEAHQMITIKNVEVIDQLFEEGKSVILTGGHYVNWEVMTLLGNRMKHDAYALYKPLKNKFMDERIQKSRSQFGMTMISIKNFRPYFIDLVKSPKLFVFGIDQSPRRGKGIWMNFLNRKTLIFTGPERLSKEYDMAIVMGQISRLGQGKYELHLELLTSDPNSFKQNEISIQTMQNLEKQIQRNPSDWLWSHNRWKHKPEDGK